MCWLSVEQVHENWEEIRTRIGEDVRFGRYFSEKSLVDDIVGQKIQVWTAGTDLIIFTRLDTYPSGIKTLRVLWAFGTGLDGMLEVIVDVFRRFAQQHGCCDVEITGREGWSRKLRRLVAARDVQSVIVIPVGTIGREN